MGVERILEFGTVRRIEVSIPGGGVGNMMRVFDALRGEGLPESARVQVSIGGMSPEDMTIVAEWIAPSDAHLAATARSTSEQEAGDA